MTKVRSGWTPTMERRADREGRQVKCLIASGGHLWMRDYFDRLPSAVRHRLAESRHNICAACMTEEAGAAARAQGLRRPSIAIYLAVIRNIERQLDGDNEAGRRSLSKRRAAR
jgi:hypothetical protein